MTHTVEFEFADPNQLAQVSNWDLDFRQIERGPMRTKVSIWGGRVLTLLEIHMSHAVHQRGAAPRNEITFGIPRPSALRQWARVDLPRRPLVAFGDGLEFDGVSRSEFGALTLSLSRSAFLHLAERLGIDLPGNSLQAGVFAAARRPSTLPEIICRARSMMSSVVSGPRAIDEDAIATELLRVLTDTESRSDRSSPRKRDRALSHAIECMSANADANLPISEICELSGASWRTLERAFLERFGIGPKAYYLGLRMQRVRAELLRAEPSVRVTDVANRWGFWHMGKFAQDYRALFGCLPSEESRVRTPPSRR